jgi:hypothetical protein
LRDFKDKYSVQTIIPDQPKKKSKIWLVQNEGKRNFNTSKKPDDFFPNPYFYLTTLEKSF